MASTTEMPVTERHPDARHEARAGRRLRTLLERFSLPLAFVVVVLLFAIARPSTFATLNNAKAILDQAAPLAVMSVGLVVVLAMREFDLSIGSVAGASAALSVSLMAYHDAPALTAIAAGLGLGLFVGFLNGLLVAVVGIPSFIATLASGSVVGGLEIALANTTIFQGIQDAYLNLTQASLFGIPMAVVIAGVVAITLGVTLRYSVFGRHAMAIGDNQVAARLVGLPVTRDRIVAFMVCGGTAALAGILLTSRAASYYPSPGAGLLLPAFAATFLSLSLGQGWRFNVGGTVLGVVFLGTITTGLTMLDQPTWVAAVVQGLVLLAAVTALARKQAAKR
jgi:ribose/xylose/arabinose/galactoside ABC-type transport system permease subunit